MYKEIIGRKKIPGMFFIVITLTVMLYLSNMISLVIQNNNVMVLSLNILFASITFMLILLEIYKINLKYVYSIIADQFIIHRLLGNNKTEMVSIKLKDIVFVGKECDQKEKYNVSSTKKYICTMYNSDKYCCIYKDGMNLRKFYFQPSDNLMKKLHSTIKKDYSYFEVKTKLSIYV